MTTFSRRNFLRTSVMGGMAATCLKPYDTLAAFGKQVDYSSSVAITTGDNRADMAFRALKPFSGEIAKAIGTRRVVLKPNNVNIDVQLASTHVDTLEGILEFLQSIGKTGNVAVSYTNLTLPTKR